MNEIDWQPPTAPKRVRKVPYSRRAIAVRCALGLGWLGVIAAVSLAALVNRPQDADVRSGAWAFLVIFNVPAVVVALVFIRTPLVLALTATSAAAVAALMSWAVMRDTSSTAALGVLTTPVLMCVIVVIGAVVDAVWRAGRAGRRSGRAQRLADLTRSRPPRSRTR